MTVCYIGGVLFTHLETSDHITHHSVLLIILTTDIHLIKHDPRGITTHRWLLCREARSLSAEAVGNSSAQWTQRRRTRRLRRTQVDFTNLSNLQRKLGFHPVVRRLEIQSPPFSHGALLFAILFKWVYSLFVQLGGFSSTLSVSVSHFFHLDSFLTPYLWSGTGVNEVLGCYLHLC